MKNVGYKPKEVTANIPYRYLKEMPATLHRCGVRYRLFILYLSKQERRQITSHKHIPRSAKMRNV